MHEPIYRDAPVIQGFTPVNRPFADSIDPLPKPSTVTTLVERPKKKKKSVGKATTVVRKPRKRKGTGISQPEKAFATSNCPLISQEVAEKGPLDCPDHGNSQRSGWASSATILGTFETMMEKIMDDDASLNNLDNRSSVPVEGLLTDEEATSLSYPAQAQGSEQMSIRPRINERQVAPQNEDLFFDEALDALPFDEMDVSPSSPDLIDSADDADFINMTITESRRGKGLECLSSSQKPQATSDHPQPLPSMEPKADSKGTNAVDEFSHKSDDEFPMSDEDCFGIGRSENEQRLANGSDVLIFEDVEALAQDPFADEDLDNELSNLSIPSLKRNYSESPPFMQRTPPRSPAQKAPTTPSTSDETAIRVKIDPDCREATATVARKPLSPISPPNTAPHQISLAPDGRPIPVIRPPFPASVLPRSPISGLSKSTVLRTCFRVGEALSAASRALRQSVDALIELYCRVKDSHREPNGYKQFFELEDLFKPDRSPTLNGVYAIWKGVELWDFDSRAFLGDKGRGKMARVIGRIKRGEGGKGWEMTVLSIWEASWSEVGVVKGIVCA